MSETSLSSVFPKYYGVRTLLDGEEFLEMEDLEHSINPKESVIFDIKIGFQTYNPASAANMIQKESYYDKAKIRYMEMLTPAEHTARKISKARWMSLNNQNSSTSINGFRITGARIRGQLVKLLPDKCTLEVDSQLVHHLLPT